MRRNRYLVIMILLVCGACALQAATATAAMVVSANIPTSCSISASSMAFGVYDPVVTNATLPLDQTAALSVFCTLSASATITVDEGKNPVTGSTAAAPLRAMADAGVDRMHYNLYKDSGHATVWGNTPATGVAYTGTGAGTSVTIYGRVPANQTGLDPILFT